MVDFVVVLDLSLMMQMRGFDVSARWAALWAAQSINWHPEHRLAAIVGYSETARQLTLHELESVSVDMTVGSNLQDALAFSEQALAGGPGQLLVFSEFVVTCHNLGRRQYFSFPPALETTEATVGEILALPRSQIGVDAFRFGSGNPDSAGQAAILRAIGTIGGHVITVDYVGAVAATKVYIAGLLYGPSSPTRFPAEHRTEQRGRDAEP